jgi:hypothetical protein
VTAVNEHRGGYHSISDGPARTAAIDGKCQCLPHSGWVNPKLVKQAYAPVVHDSRQYYRLTDKTPKIE